MKIEIFQPAETRIREIWRYTEDAWGTEQAENYTRGLSQVINQLTVRRHLWRTVEDDVLKGVFFMRYKHHYIFFRQLRNGSIGIISVLHENMDIPSHLKEDGGKIF